MCDPVLIASAAAQGVGAMMQSQAANRRDEARKAYIDQDCLLYTSPSPRDV